ncbi:MAG: hypothetical protein KDH96_01165 [Candidatus Riesia sp.]|nr:hypothetical protein [Candidatus Riesia sp.]
MNEINQSIINDMTRELSTNAKQYIDNLVSREVEILSHEDMIFLDALVDCFVLYDNYEQVTGNKNFSPYNLPLNELLRFFEINMEILIAFANTELFSNINI